MDLRIGDIVGRKSYDCDIVFKIHDILKQGDNYIIVLKGVNLRILADAPLNDIVKLPQAKVNEAFNSFTKKIEKVDAKLSKLLRQTEARFFGRSAGTTFKRPGKVLHIDGDSAYLEMCLKAYKENQIEAIGRMVPEAEQPKRVTELLKQYNPDILVLTGHDAMIKTAANSANTAPRNVDQVSRYRNSGYYIEGVKQARLYEPSLDDLVIFAGACQSYFEGIMAAGANFASSPARILIHALDPVMICKSVAFATIDRVIPLEAMLNSTISGIKGIGGIQTRGKYRDGMPNTLNEKL